jgi:hypothetical protein
MHFACLFLSSLVSFAQKPDTPRNGAHDTKPTAAGAESTAPSRQAGAASEPTLQGCIRVAQGKYVLQGTHGEIVPLAGTQDFASDVDHTVRIRGRYEASSIPGGKPANSTSTNGKSTQRAPEFIVSALEMVSGVCTADENNSAMDPAMPKQKEQ